MLTCICGAMATHLSLSNVVFWKRIAGQSRTLVWSARNDGASPMLARERAWTRAAELVEHGALRAADGETVIVSCRDDRLGLWALLYVEPHRRLDDQDCELVQELLRQMLDSPHSDAATGA